MDAKYVGTLRGGGATLNIDKFNEHTMGIDITCMKCWELKGLFVHLGRMLASLPAREKVRSYT